MKKKTIIYKIRNNKVNVNFVKFKILDIILLSYYYIILSSLILSNNKFFKLLFYSELTITITGEGTQFILSNKTFYSGNKVQFNNFPDEILVNGIKSEKIDYFLTGLTGPENNITMRWNEPLDNMDAMFYELSNIKMIDLTKMDTSNLILMRRTFKGCTSLTSIKLNNFNTSLVKNMEYLFFDCSALTSLDIENFDTSKVTNMEHMFNGCSSLTSLNLKKFNTSLVENMDSLFYKCRNLISLIIAIL